MLVFSLCGDNKEANITKVGGGLVTIQVKTDEKNRSDGGQCTMECTREGFQKEKKEIH